jgi:hypothetical protein
VGGVSGSSRAGPPAAASGSEDGEGEGQIVLPARDPQVCICLYVC